MKLIPIFVLAIFVLSGISVIPVASAAVSVPNSVEGSWTSWKLVTDRLLLSPSGSTLKVTSECNGVENFAGAVISVDESGNILWVDGGTFNSDWLINGVKAQVVSCTKSGGGTNTNGIFGGAASSLGTYKVMSNFSVDSTFHIYQGVTQLQTISDANQPGVFNGTGYPMVGMSSSGQWIVALGPSKCATNGSGNQCYYIQLFQGVGSGPTTPLTSNVVNCQPGACGPIITNQGGTTQNVNGTILPPNVNNALNQVKANPFPYGLIVLIIIASVGAAVALGQQNKSKKNTGGFRIPENHPARKRGR